MPEVASSGEVISSGQEASEDMGEFCMPRHARARSFIVILPDLVFGPEHHEAENKQLDAATQQCPICALSEFQTALDFAFAVRCVWITAVMRLSQ